MTVAATFPYLFIRCLELYGMKIKELNELDDKTLQDLLGRVPFFKELRLRHPEQMSIMLGHSCLVELEPGETIMRRGEKGTWLYFLIKGRLAVFADDPLTEQPINYITPGELFGDLALLSDKERKATVAADPKERTTLVFACDFKPFGVLTDFSRVPLGCKLVFYRTTVHSIRWRLEVLRMDQPDHPLVVQLRKVPVYTGPKECLDELHGVHQQACYLADLLQQWNSQNGKPMDTLLVGLAN
jgi:CRP/FNR family cyclic AMP-dependent transcriptional regulator